VRPATTDAPLLAVGRGGKASLADTEEFILFVRGKACDLVHPVITPRFLPTCSEPLLCGLGALAAKYQVRGGRRLMQFSGFFG
jgi:cytosine/adenosine deaminase-related metal-dependent hydrolase